MTEGGEFASLFIYAHTLIPIIISDLKKCRK